MAPAQSHVGVILFTIFVNVISKIKLWFLTLCLWKPICYFSELNDVSLSLTQSFRKSNVRLKKSPIVFSDVYSDKEDEAVSERVQKVKFIKAICFKEDLLNLSVSHRKGKIFFLMNQKNSEVCRDYQLLLKRAETQSLKKRMRCTFFLRITVAPWLKKM